MISPRDVHWDVNWCGRLNMYMYMYVHYIPLNNGHIGADHCVDYREVVLSLEVKMYYHYIGRYIEKCLLYGGVLYQRIHYYTYMLSS